MLPQDHDDLDIADHIYEAAFVCELWPSALHAVSRLTSSAGGAIFTISDNMPVRAIGEAHLRPLLAEFVAGDAWTLSQSVQRVCDSQPASFVRIDDFITLAEIERDPVYRRARTFGVGSPVCTSIATPSGELVLFVFQRWLTDGDYDQAEVDRLNGLRPHLARAGLLAARLGMERARSTTSALREIGLPAAVLTKSGRVLAANSLLEEMASVFLPAAHGGLALGNAAADALFRQAIAQNAGLGVVRSIPVPATKGQPALILHVLPLRRAAHEIFSGADILVAATAVSASAIVPSPAILTGLFDLSPAEARLASALSSGRTLQAVAAESGITVKSARTYLDRVFQKTGTNRQGQLIALLKSAQSFV
ncbi:helix-turn-helix transcriptional regulator [Bradyrhizobium sp. Arg314]